MQSDRIAIVGAGLAGLTTALACLQAGFAVCLVDEAPESQLRDAKDPRTTALSFTSVLMFQRLSVWDQVLSASIAIERMEVSTETQAKLRFDPQDVGDMPMGYIVPNAALKQALLNALQPFKTSGQFQIYEQCKLKDIEIGSHNTQLTLQGRESQTETLSVDLLIACDGRRSKARRLLSMPEFSRDYRQCGLVSTVQLSRPHKGTAFQVFSALGPLALLPLPTDQPESTHASLIWSCPKDKAAELNALDETSFVFMANRHLPQDFPRLKSTGPRVNFPLHAHYLPGLVRPGVALVGEAAHGVHPLAGQGFNLTMRDIGVLVEALNENQNSGLPLGHLTGLESYEKRRLGDTALMFAVTDLLGLGMGPSGKPRLPQFAQHLGFQMVDQSQNLKAHLTRHAMGLTDDLPLMMQP